MSSKGTVLTFSIVVVVALATILSNLTVASMSAQYPAVAQASGGDKVGGIKVSIVSGASTMADKAFSPNPTAAKVGDTITWSNDDTTTHTVTSGSGPSDPNKGKEFDSSPNFNPLLAPKQTFQHTFTTAGEIPYFCQLHPTMVGKVVVS